MNNILNDISYCFALIASIFEQRVFKGTYEEPQSVRHINYYHFPERTCSEKHFTH